MSTACFHQTLEDVQWRSRMARDDRLGVACHVPERVVGIRDGSEDHSGAERFGRYRIPHLPRIARHCGEVSEKVFVEFGGKPFESALRLSPGSRESLRARAVGKPDRFAGFVTGR